VRLKIRSLSLNLPFGLGGVDLEVSELDARTAWTLYVEYSTRVAVQQLEPGTGSAREALGSLHSLFDTTRTVLREAGPEVGMGPESVGAVAIRILNEGVRPFLVKWHGELARLARSQGADDADESDWAGRAEFDSDLGRVQKELARYVDMLADIAGVRR
jgi:hypothetical protein